MEKILIICTILSFLCQLTNSVSPPAYAVNAPKIFNRWIQNKIIVSLYSVPANTNITVEVVGTNSQSKTQMQVYDVSPNPVSLIFPLEFDSQWKNGVYKVTINLVGGLKITPDYSIDIPMVDEKSVILVQTQTDLYKPGDIVLFRVIILNELLLPVPSKYINEMKLYIKDPSGATRAQFFKKDGEIVSSNIYGTNYFNITNGVTNDIYFRINSKDLIGDWRIEVNLNSQIEVHHFKVDNFKLPFANVEIIMPDYKTYRNPILNMDINSFYTFKKPLQGSGSIKITKLEECDNKIKIENRTTWEQAISVSGNSKEQIDFRDTRLLNANCEATFELKAVIIDNITSEEYSAVKTVKYLKQSLVAKFLNSYEKIKPGLNFRVVIKIINIENTIELKDQLNKITFDAKYNLKDNTTKQAIPLTVEKNHDIIILDFKTPPLTSQMKINLNFENELLTSFTYSSYSDCKNTQISIKLQEPTKNIKVNDKVSVIVFGTEPMDFLTYHCIVSNKVIQSNIVAIASPDTLAQFNVDVTKNMAPFLTLVVNFYSKTTGIIAIDYINLEITGFLMNHIHISGDQQTKPQNETTFSIDTEMESDVFIVGFDKAMMRDTFQTISEQFFLDSLRKIFNDNNGQQLDQLINFKTNAVSQCSTYYDLDTFDVPEATSPQRTNDNTRQDFRKAWIWDRISMQKNQTRNLKARLPDSITSWEINALSLNINSGIGIMSQQFEVTSFKPLFIQIKTPYSIIKNVKQTLEILVFNYLTEVTQVNIVVENSPKSTVEVMFYNCESNLTISPNQIQIFVCSINCSDIGFVQLNAKAYANSKSFKFITDEISDKFLIEYDGLNRKFINEIFTDLSNEELIETRIHKSIVINRPLNMIEGSQAIYLMAKYENKLQHWFSILQQFLNVPDFQFVALTMQCDQRMLILSQQISQLRYLQLLGKSDQTKLNSFNAIMMTGFNTRCSQNPNDGSLVSIGYTATAAAPLNQIRSSTWVTALFLKSMQTLKKYQTDNQNIIYQTQAWLKRQSVNTGEFLDPDPQFRLRPNVGHYGLYLTSFVYIALESDTKYFDPENQAIVYIEELYSTVTNLYDKMISCYAFHIAKHQLKDECFKYIMFKSVKDKDVIYWNGLDGKPDIESTSYALLILKYRKYYSSALSVFKYLKSIQNPQGMIGDPFQTSLALDAMSELIESNKLFNQREKAIKFNIYDGFENRSFTITPQNEITQVIELSKDTENIDVIAEGYGDAMIYAINDCNLLKLNNHSQQVSDHYESDTIAICKRLDLSSGSINIINEINLPDGYIFNRNVSVTGIGKSDAIETDSSGTHIKIYSDKIENEVTCVDIPIIRGPNILVPVPAPIDIYPKTDFSNLRVKELLK